MLGVVDLDFWAVGIDQFDIDGVDIVHGEPIAVAYTRQIGRQNSFSLYLHLLDIPATLAECNRILVSGGEIEIVAPFLSDNLKLIQRGEYGRAFYELFCVDVEFQYRYLHQDKLFELIESGISFREHKTSWRDGRKFNAGELLGFEALINAFPRLYEKFFSSFVPASEVYFRLQKKT